MTTWNMSRLIVVDKGSKIPNSGLSHQLLDFCSSRLPYNHSRGHVYERHVPTQHRTVTSRSIGFTKVSLTMGGMRSEARRVQCHSNPQAAQAIAAATSTVLCMVVIDGFICFATTCTRASPLKRWQLSKSQLHVTIIVKLGVGLMDDGPTHYLLCVPVRMDGCMQ